MRTVIAGSRSITDLEHVRKAVLLSRFVITEVVSGTAPGVDTLGERWAAENGIPVRRMPADWNTGKGAGFVRNRKMAEYCDQVLILWDRRSNGTRHMISVAGQLRRPLYVYCP